MQSKIKEAAEERTTILDRMKLGQPSNHLTKRLLLASPTSRRESKLHQTGISGTFCGKEMRTWSCSSTFLSTTDLYVQGWSLFPFLPR